MLKKDSEVMSKIIKLTESDIIRIAKRVISEREDLNDPHFRLFVPEEFDGAILELGPHPTPGTIIDVYNDIFQEDVSELVDFNEDLFLFYDAYGDEVTPEHIYELIDEFVKDEDSWDNDYNY
jgi:hypothetical protein